MEALNKYEIRTCILVIVALLAFVLTRVLHITISSIYDPSYFLISHTIFELFSIFVSYSIFFHGWLTFQHTHSAQKLNLSLIFFAVGSIDFLHTLSYKGMPFFQSDHTLQVATWFWIAGRLIESIGIGYFIVRQKDGEITERWKNTKIVITILLVILLIFSIMMFPGHLPVLVQEGVGVTNTKIILEYLVSMIHFVTLVILFRQYLENRNHDYLITFTGIIFILMAELVFTLYRNVYDIDNLLGHMYKVVGYFYLFRGIFFPQFRAIFEGKEKAELERQLAVEELKEQESKVTSNILMAQEEERMRVSRHLHDGVGQSLYSILVSLKMLKQLGLDQKTVHQLENVEKLTSQSMDEVKSIAFQLRPSSLDDLGLFSAIRTHIQRYESTFGIKVELEFSGKKQRYSREIETELYRIFQEALNNAAKYAETDKIIVRIINNINSVELQIIDEGKGFNIQGYHDSHWQKGIGLYSMKERASLLKGTLEIESIENVGTKIKVVIPIQDQADSI